MILAAGRGERMRPLTDSLPKPLLEAGDRSLIEHHVDALARAGFDRIVINHAHLGEMIEARLGDGARHGVEIVYSREGASALETGGGIRRALPLLGGDPFLVVNADIWSDFPFADLPRRPAGLAHLVLVPNPPEHAGGDFALEASGRVSNDGPVRRTYAGIAVLSPRLVADRTGAFRLAPLLREAAERGKVSGELYLGQWMDIGTPDRLGRLRELLARDGSGRR